MSVDSCLSFYAYYIAFITFPDVIKFDSSNWNLLVPLYTVCDIVAFLVIDRIFFSKKFAN